ncbi:MAG: RidA family protein [Planctomycetes bacterium]|nr:RidA family protein [Planctomycetota bacterium]
MTRSVVSTSHAPKAIGPYNQAIVAGGFVHCSGQVAFDPATGEFLNGDIRAQTERALLNLKAVLAQAGTSFSNVVKCNVYLIDMGDFAAMNEVYARHFTGEPPARSTVAVAALPRGARVEIDCTALLS